MSKQEKSKPDLAEVQVNKNKDINYEDTQNKNFSLSLIGDSIFLSQHNVKTCEVGEWKILNKTTETREIEVYTQENKWLSLTLFRDRESQEITK